MHLYFPASSKRTSSICNKPSDVTLVLLLGNDPSALTQDSSGVGFPEAEQNRAAVLVSLTVSCEAGEIVTLGKEMDSPGSPLIPGMPGGPISPVIPVSPLMPGGPIVPCFPPGPGGPMIPWGPFLPLLPGAPGSPLGQTLRPTLFRQIFLKLEVTTASKTSFMLAELLKVGLLAVLRVIL